MIWVDAQLSPQLSKWISESFLIDSKALRELGLRDAMDDEIFMEAKKNNAIILTKDADFIDLVNRLSSPPKIIWLTCGNTSNEKMKTILNEKLMEAIEILKTTDVVEISD